MLSLKYPSVEDWSVRTTPDPAFEALDRQIERRFLDTEVPTDARYEALFRYFLRGFVAYRTPDGARAFYPGTPSVHGRPVDGLEGFSRIAPLAAGWLAGGRSQIVNLPDFGDVDLAELLRTGIESGTNPATPGYWGDYDTSDQRYVEAADVALAVWLGRNAIWEPMDAAARTNLVRWLMQSQGAPADYRHGNWRLFGLIVNRVLRDLGQPVDDAAFESGLAAVIDLHVGEGWFRDAPDTDFDYYNAWAFHYALYWLAHIDPGLDDTFLRTARRDFVGLYRHFMSPEGLPIMGRSVCYRTAASVPLVISAAAGDGAIPPGEARRAMDVVWRYFVARDALKDGTLTPGYCGADPRVMDAYSGPASCLWGLRSLVVAFSLPLEHAFWQSPPAPLPVERGDYVLESATTGWRVVGDRDVLEVVVEKPGNPDNPELNPYTWRHRAMSELLRRPYGFGNRRAKYERASYSSAAPFTGCLRPDTDADAG